MSAEEVSKAKRRMLFFDALPPRIRFKLAETGLIRVRDDSGEPSSIRWRVLPVQRLQATPAASQLVFPLQR